MTIEHDYIFDSVLIYTFVQNRIKLREKTKQSHDIHMIQPYLSHVCIYTVTSVIVQNIKHVTFATS